MGMVKIPETHQAICDFCGATSKTVSDRRPSTYCWFSIEGDALDYQGNAVAANNSRYLLCTACAQNTVRALDEVRKATFKKAPT